MDAFWLSLAIIFLAELGDKTQLVALTLASRYRAAVVLAGIFAATLVVHIVSVLLGGGLGEVLPRNWIALGAGVAFIGFGLWTLRGDCIEDGEGVRRGRSPFWIVTTTFFLAELGDKTMLSTVTLATSHDPIPVWLGSSLGMVVSDGLAIAVGCLLGTRLPERAVKTGAALIFFGFGLYSALQGARELHPVTWAGAALVVTAMVFVYWQDRVQTAVDRKQEPERASQTGMA